jgi:glycosyltransferase involved in cell wall biosynthesis
MNTPSITLCTFTYNDGRLADDLVRHVATWTVRPDAILITDDGSTPPYAPDDLPQGARVLRLPRNLGITKAKHLGVSAAATELVLSMDCDVRVAPEWLELCLPHALRPEVGAVCGPVLHDGGADLVSRFLRAFGDNHHQGADGPVDFIPGNAYLIRRAVWELVGGFGDYSRSVCEDHHLSAKIRAAGLTLYCEGRARAAQIRRISRQAMVKRIWEWCHEPVKGNLPGQEDFAGYLWAAFVVPLADRLTFAAERGEPLFIYLELLYFCHIALDMLRFAAAARGYDPDLAAAWLAALARLTRGRPKLAALLRSDLAALGHDLAPWRARAGAERAAGPEPGPFDEIFSVFESLAATGVYDWLDREGVRAVLAEERAGAVDFSFYHNAAHGAGANA